MPGNLILLSWSDVSVRVVSKHRLNNLRVSFNFDILSSNLPLAYLRGKKREQKRFTFVHLGRVDSSRGRSDQNYLAMVA